MVPPLRRLTLEKPQSKQRALAPTLGASPRLGMPVIRHGFGGPPPRAIHGAGRLNRHPCRFTPQIHAEFRPACLTGRLRSKSKTKRGGLTAGLIDEACAVPCGSWLACDGINWVCLMYRGVCIAGKPAPTLLTEIDTKKSVGFKAAALLLLILLAPSNTLAERRLESVGNPAGRRVSRPAPWMAHGGGPRIQAGVSNRVEIQAISAKCF